MPICIIKNLQCNSPFNGLCVALDTDTMNVVTNHQPLVRSIMREVVAIANALGVKELTEDHIDKQIDNTLNMKPYAPSMKVDYDNRRKMEVYYLYTRAVMEAEQLGVPCPCLKDLEEKLVCINDRLG